MHDLVSEAKIKRFIETQWWIYFGFLMGFVMTLFVIAKITSTHPSTPSSGSTKAFETVKWVFIVFSLTLVAANLWLRKNFLSHGKRYRKCGNMQEVFMHYNRYFLWSLGMSEIVAIFSYIIAFLTMRMSQGLILFIIAGISFALSTPGSKNLRRIIEGRLAEHSGSIESFVGELKPESVVPGVATGADIKIPPLLSRTIAYLLDLVLISFLAFLAVTFITGNRNARIDDALYRWLTVFLFIVYHAFSIYFFGRTVGCLVLRLKIVSRSESRLTLRRSFARGALMVLVLFRWAGIPFILLIHIAEMAIAVYRKDKYKLTSWDKVAKTLVIRA